MTRLEDAQVAQAIGGLRRLPNETEWVEFKSNRSVPAEIGQYISALANAAALEQQERGYLVWGVDDATHDLVGTTFDPARAKGAGNEDLVPWLQRLLDPVPFFSFHATEVAGHSVVLLAVTAADDRPVTFQREAFIRVGSYTKKLRDAPERERVLWSTLEARCFEAMTAADGLDANQVVDLLDAERFTAMMRAPASADIEADVQRLSDHGLARYDVASKWTITNLGALLFARRIADFPHLERKAVRLVQYDGATRISSIREEVETVGYAIGFEGLLQRVSELLPTSEIIRGAYRETIPAYPELAMRELVANMVVHQDLSATGTGPMVEVFDDRVEITNPGKPLVPKDRFIDSPPQSRNEKLAKAMRQLRICEERGSGWDKIAFEVELNHLPAPLIETTSAHTRVVMFGPRKLRDMQKDDRVRAIYLHACLLAVERRQATNTTVRARFGLPDGAADRASRMIRDAVEAQWIVPFDPNAGKRAMSYVPFWASTEA